MAAKKIGKTLLSRHNIALRNAIECFDTYISLLEDRIVALGGEHGTAIAEYRKTHPREMKKLNAIPGTKPNKKKPRSRPVRGAP